MGQEIQKKYDIDIVRKLVNILSETRYIDYDKWILLGLCLHNISDNETMMNIFKEFSERDPSKSSKTDFSKLWKSLKKKNNGLLMGTLRYWASNDNPEEFKKIRNEEIDKRLSMTIQEDGNTPYDIAKVLKEMYSDLYVCSNISKNSWYEFINHRWVKMESGFKLFLNISEELVLYYKNKIKNLRKQEVEIDEVSGDYEEEEYRLVLSKKKEIIDKIIKNLKTTSFKKNLMEESRNLFYDPLFVEKLDEVSKHLICFNNGVYDLDNLYLREGHPYDYISFTTGIDYVEYNDNNQDIMKVFDILSNMHETREKTNYFLTTLAMSLHGIKNDQRIDFWTGMVQMVNR